MPDEKKRKRKRSRLEKIRKKATLLREKREKRRRKEFNWTKLISRNAPLVPPESGHRIVGPAQAMVDYAKPVMEIIKADDIDSMNKAMSIAQLCWNSAVLDNPAAQKELRKEAVKLLDIPDPESFIDMMIERHRKMFPDLKNERGTLGFYMKEKVVDEPVEFTPFDESTLNLKDKPILPTAKENELILIMKELEVHFENGDDYGDYEDKLLKFEDDLTGCYERWCVAKGVPSRDANSFAFAVHSFLNYLYGYKMGTLLDIPRPAIVEFMKTFFIRKCLSEPREMSMMPTALKLFMNYLEEKGIAPYAKQNLIDIESLEKKFQKNLRKFINP